MKGRSSKETGGKSAAAEGTLRVFLPLFFYLNPSPFLHPSLRSQVLEVVEYRLYGPCFVTTRRLHAVLPG